ncbi:MAG: OmpA family protein [Flavobacteriales bacterium]|nr:OmpA family protein [Flavobacteriales bacterium]MBL6873387.1 OmpA family protein [Flavobacteriales bacterium]
MKKQALFIIVFSFLWGILYSQNKDDLNKGDDSYLLFELGIVYPELEFIDSKGEQSLNTDLTNISSNRIAIGGGGPIVNRLGYLLTLSSNRYDLRTYYTESNFDYYVHYSFDYLALDGGLTFRFLKPTVKWSPFLKVGASYNYLLSGFQEMNNLTVDLKKNEDYTNEHIDLNFGLNLRRKLGRFSHFWLGYNYKLGLIENENISQQQYNINAHSATLGFSISPDAFKKKDDDLKRILKKCNDNIDDLRAELLLLMEQDADTAANEFRQFVTPDENENSPLRDEIKAYVTTLFPEDSLDINSDSKTVILFPTNKTDYYEIFQQDLDDLIVTLKNKAAKSIKVVGYADLRGYDDDNLTLSKNRAKTVINFLINNGISSEIISYDFRGATTKFDDIVLMSNRRVEIFIER